MVKYPSFSEVASCFILLIIFITDFLSANCFVLLYGFVTLNNISASDLILSTVCLQLRWKISITGGEDDLVQVWSMDDRKIVAWGEGHNSWVMVSPTINFLNVPRQT